MKNYRKVIVILLAMSMVTFGLIGAFAAETNATTDEQPAATTNAAPSTQQQAAASQPDEAANQTQDQNLMRSKRGSRRWSRLLRFIVNAIILGIVGILLLIIGYYIWEMITVNYSVREQLVDHKNTAVAIVTASFVLGMAIVIGIALTKI